MAGTMRYFCATITLQCPPGNVSRSKISKFGLEIYLDATIKSKYCSKYNNLPSGHVDWRFTRYSTFVITEDIVNKQHILQIKQPGSESMFRHVSH